jgi:hypothetical protein
MRRTKVVLRCVDIQRQAREENGGGSGDASQDGHDDECEGEQRLKTENRRRVRVLPEHEKWRDQRLGARTIYESA